MLEFAHLIFMAATQKSWNSRRVQTLDEWRSSVAGTPMAPVVDELHEMFTTDGKGVGFIDHWNNIHWTKHEHLLCFSLEGMGDSEYVFAHNSEMAFSPGAGDRFNAGSTAKVGVYCLSPHPFVTPMLARFVRHTVLQERDWLISAGFDDHAHVATTAMHMPAELIAEGIPVIYGHRVDFLFYEMETVGRVGGERVATRKPVSVTDIDDHVARLYDRGTRTFTDLGGTFRGSVRRTKT